MQPLRPKLKTTVIFIVALAAIASFGYTAYEEYLDSSKPIQAKVDIGGYGLYVNCIGKGKPTVVFENGYGNEHHTWKAVQREVAKLTRTFSYDRAGIGTSDLSPLKWTSQNEVKELHALLQAAKVRGPYIIVAHSIGGFNARLFAAEYPKEVAGIVFVDSTHEIIGERLKQLPLGDQDTMYRYFITGAEQVIEASKQDALRNMPIIVLSADQKGSGITEEGRKDLEYQQKSIASLSDKSEHIFVKDSSHYIQTDQPGILVDVIEKLITMTRNE